MTRARAALVVWAAALGCAAAARPAAAHGRTPAVLSLALSGRDDVALGTTFGLLVGGGGGAPWRWICEEAIGYDARFAPHVAHLPDGALVVAAFDGLARSTDGGCSWRQAPETRGPGLTGLAVPPGTSDVYITTGGRGPPFVLLRSRDGGVSFARTGLARAEPLSNVLVTPGSQRRLYVGAFAEGTPPVFLRSDDGGERWRETPHPEEPPTYAFGLLAVSPHDPDVVFTRTRNAYGNGAWRSDDGGNRFVKVFEAPDAPFDVVFPDDRSTVLLLTTGGIYRSLDGGRSFVPPPVALYRPCAAARATGFYLCGDVTSDGWLLGRGGDEAGPFAPLLEDFPRIAGPLMCPAGTATAVTCGALWPEVAGEIGAPLGGAADPRDARANLGGGADSPGADASFADARAVSPEAGANLPDAGTNPRDASRARGCSVSASTAAPDLAWPICAAGLLLGWRGRARRSE